MVISNIIYVTIKDLHNNIVTVTTMVEKNGMDQVRLKIGIGEKRDEIYGGKRQRPREILKNMVE